MKKNICVLIQARVLFYISSLVHSPKQILILFWTNSVVFVEFVIFMSYDSNDRSKVIIDQKNRELWIFNPNLKNNLT